MVNFILLQANVVFNQQCSIFDKYKDTKEGRNDAFRDIIDIIKNKKVIKVNPRVTEYYFIYIKEIDKDIIYCQLAKKTQMERYVIEESGVKQGLIDNYPPIDVFVNLKSQQFAIEIKTGVLSNAATVSVITNLINSLIEDYNVFFNIIQDRKEFWDLVSNEESIQEITFNLVVPNFFGATEDAKLLVEGAKDEVNADRVELSFKNKKGKLKITLKSLDSYVRYASMSGDWKIKYKGYGEKKYKIVTSADCSLKKEIEEEIMNTIKEGFNVNHEEYNILIEKIKGLFYNE